MKIKSKDKYLLAEEGIYYYIEPVYETGPQFTDKFSFMYDPPKIISFQIYQMTEQQFIACKKEYEKFDVIDVRNRKTELKWIKSMSTEEFYNFITTF